MRWMRASGTVRSPPMQKRYTFHPVESQEENVRMYIFPRLADILEEKEARTMDMTNEEYSRYVAGLAKPSPLWKDLIWAFLVGGSICTLGQGLGDLYQSWGLDKTDAGTAVSVTLIFLSAFFTALGWFDKLAQHAGAGTLVPITGFANAVASPALEFKSEGLVLGVGARMFIIAGPVIVYGLVASVIYGVILVLMGG